MTNAMGNVGGFVGRHLTGWIWRTTGSFAMATRYIAFWLASAGIPILTLQKRLPLIRCGSTCTPGVIPPRKPNRGSEWARLDSNQGPTDYESAALTAELRARGRCNIIPRKENSPT